MCLRAGANPLMGDQPLESLENSAATIHPGSFGALVASAADGAEAVGASRRVVLVVEDDPIILETTVENLHDLGYSTVSAVDAAEAIAVLRSDRPVDLMFSDIVMPGGMNGVEPAEYAKELRPGMPVALTSGYSAAIVNGVPDGIPLLPKPYLRADLARTLAGLIAG
jgi:CheY-like chemotaxis protein